MSGQRSAVNAEEGVELVADVERLITCLQRVRLKLNADSFKSLKRSVVPYSRLSLRCVASIHRQQKSF